MVVGAHLASERMATYRQVTDAHLLALARRHGGRLATFDRGVSGLAEGSLEEAIVVRVAYARGAGLRLDHHTCLLDQFDQIIRLHPSPDQHLPQSWVAQDPP